jgi:hypothetical protein
MHHAEAAMAVNQRKLGESLAHFIHCIIPGKRIQQALLYARPWPAKLRGQPRNPIFPLVIYRRLCP